MDATLASTLERGAGPGRMLPPLAALAALALAATASAAPPTTYRVIPLSPTISIADINATGQVAFTEIIFGEPLQVRAIFYDGRTRQDLGTLGGTTSIPTALNDAGQITGMSTTREGINRAYRWSRSTGMVDLAGPGTGFSFGTDINNKGWVTGFAEFSPGSTNAFRWSPQTGMVNLGSPNFESIGNALNDAGTVAGWAQDVAGAPSQNAVRWPGTTPIPITPFPTALSAALDINNAGQIVGNGALDPTRSERAFLWSAQSGVVDLGVSTALARAERINEKGLVIGNSYASDITRGFIWSRETGPIVLPSPGGGTAVTTDLNNRGQVVGSYRDRAFVWTRAEGLVDLTSRVANAPPDLKLVQGIAISDNGSIVAAANTGLVLLVPRVGGHNEAPVLAPIKLTGTPRVNTLLSFHAAFRDADLRDTHKASWDWGDGSRSAGTVSGKNGAGSASGQHAYRKAGIYTVRLTITDSAGQRTTVMRTVVVCGSDSAIVGEGAFLSPPGAYKAGPARPSLASFTFASDNGANLAQVRFNVGNLAFRSGRVESVAVKGGRVEYRGAGTVNGSGNYRFLMTAAAGAKSAGNRFQIRISHTDPATKAEVVDYDNLTAGSVVNAGVSVDLDSE